MASVPHAVPQPDVILRYSNGAAVIHWVTAAFVVTQVYIGFTFGDLPRGPERTELFTWHKTVGVTILILAAVRLLWRLTHKPPPYPPELPRWERLAGTWNHRAFYVVLFALPLTGLAAVSGRGATTELIGGIPFPTIPGLPEDAPFGDIHEWLVFATIALLVLHVGAALKHQFLDKSRAEGRMPPFRERDRTPTTPVN